MNFLEQIVEHKREEIAKRKREMKASSFSSMEYSDRKTISLRESLINTSRFAIIAEIKRYSPSAGVLNNDLSPSMLAAEYERNGAAAISVLTDERFFSG